MKLIVEKQGENVKAIKIEYTPAEALIINHAMRRYACDEEVNKKDREIMERMLEVEPIFTDFEHKAEIVISQLRADRDKLQEAIKALGEDLRKCQKSITDEKVLIGFNMAVALCNNHLAEKDNQDTVPFDFELYQAGLMDMPKGMIDVLDKIRAEIEEVQTYKMFEGEDTVYVERNDVLAIIDKYKESEELE